MTKVACTYSYRYFSSGLHVSLPEKSKRRHLYDFQGSWKCRGPPKTIFLDSGSTELLKLNHERYEHETPHSRGRLATTRGKAKKCENHERYKVNCCNFECVEIRTFVQNSHRDWFRIFCKPWIWKQNWKACNGNLSIFASTTHPLKPTQPVGL